MPNAKTKMKWVHMIIGKNYCFSIQHESDFVIDEGHRMKNTQSKLAQMLTTYYHLRYRPPSWVLPYIVDTNRTRQSGLWSLASGCAHLRCFVGGDSGEGVIRTVIIVVVIFKERG
jgi:hypothetical protein